MNKKFIWLGLLLTFMSVFNLSAAIRRVGFGAIPFAGVDYTNFADAQAASLPGDTIQYYLNTGVSVTVIKRLVIIGYGHHFNIHSNLSVLNDWYPSYMGSITFSSGSQNSVVIGMWFNYCNIQTSDITIKRCVVDYLQINNGPISINNLLVEACVIRGTFSMLTPSTNTRIYNSILRGFTADNNISSTGFMINCVTVYGEILDFKTASWYIKNSIIFNLMYITNCVFDDNIFAAAQPPNLPLGSNNRWGADWTLIFERLGNYNSGASTLYPGDPGNSLFDENFYLLRSGSIAINGGYDMLGNPTDCGIFGGEPAYRYKLSGVPAVPSFYKLTAPGNAAISNPYNITISVKSNN